MSDMLEIELLERGMDSALLNPDERAEVVDELGREGIHWGETPAPSRDPYHDIIFPREERLHFAIETLVMLVASGFVGAITNDGWGLMKRAAARILARQSEKTYAVQPTVWFVLRDGDDQIAIRAYLARALMGTRQGAFEAELSEVLDETDWSALADAIADARARTPSPPATVYRALYGAQGWKIEAVPSLADLG